MSDQTGSEKIQTIVPELPKPEYPKVEMPQAPNINLPKDAPHVSCEGEVYEPPRDNSHIKPPEEGMPRILIGIPVLTFSYEFVESFLKFWTSICLMAKGKFQVGYQFMYRKPVHMAEETLVEIARYNKCTHILFIDDDIFGIKLEDLVKLLEADKDVIAGVMYASKFPHAMCVFRRYDVNRKVTDMPVDTSMYRLYEVPCHCTNPECSVGLSHWDAKFCPVCGTAQDNLIQKADLVPFCFTLMKLSIFDKIKRPWFHCTTGYPSDSWFADRCSESGIQQWGHMAVRLNHAGVNDKTKPYYVQMGIEERRAQPNAMINLTPEDMQKHEYMLYTKMNEAEKKMKPEPEMITPGNTGEEKK